MESLFGVTQSVAHDVERSRTLFELSKNVYAACTAGRTFRIIRFVGLDPATWKYELIDTMLSEEPLENKRVTCKKGTS